MQDEYTLVHFDNFNLTTRFGERMNSRRAAESQVRVAIMSAEAESGEDYIQTRESSLSTASEITNGLRTPDLYNRGIADGLGSQDWAKDCSNYCSYGEKMLQLQELAKDEGIVQNEFELVSAALQCKTSVSSCSLVFDALEGNPVCLIRVSSTEIMGECIDIAKNTKAMHISVIVAIDAALAHECDEEFSTFDEGLWDQLDWTVLMEKNQDLTLILNSFEFHSHATVMFGPRYDYETKNWTSEVSIWVCMRDFTWKSFLNKKREFRTTDHSGLYVHYWVLDLNEQVRLSSQNDVKAWHKFDGQKIMPGCLFLLDINNPDVNPMGTIGPSLHTLFPEKLYPLNWFLTCSHTFFGSIGDYEFRAIIGENNLLCAEEPFLPIGKLVHYFDKLDLAVVSIDTNYNYKVKLSNTTSMDVPALEYLQEPVTATLLNEYKKRYVYKSGGTTGVTRGTVVTYGMECGGIGRYGKFKRAHYMYVQAKPEVLVSFYTPKFSDSGDSGGPVFFDEYTPSEAPTDPSTADVPLKVPPTCIGLHNTGSSAVNISGVRLFLNDMCDWLATIQDHSFEKLEKEEEDGYIVDGDELHV